MKAASAMLIAAALALPVVGGALDDDGLQEVVRQGSMYYGQGKHDLALREFRRVLRFDARNRIALHHIARIHAIQKRYREAVDTVRTLQEYGVALHSDAVQETLQVVLDGILQIEDFKARADALVHFRETLLGLGARDSSRADAHLMCLYAKLGEMQLHLVARSRYFKSQAPSPEVYITGGVRCLDYDVNLDDAVGYFERGLELIDEVEKKLKPSGNPDFDRARKTALGARRTVVAHQLAYACHRLGWDDVKRNILVASESEPGAQFVEVAGLPAVGGNRVAVGDYDGDGLEDLCVAGRILRNKGGRRFEDTTEKTGIRARGSPTPLWLDYDGDGMLDLLLGGLPSLALWRNYGDGTFVDVTGSMGLALRLPGLPSGLAAGDYDGDGLVDLFVACFETPGRLGVPRPNLLLRNTGRRFLDVTARAGLRGARFHSSRAAAWGDFNGDALQDLYVANGRLEPNQLWVNQGNGRFLERAVAAGVQGMLGRGRLSKSFGNTVACSWGDLNGDGAADVLVAEVIAVRYAGIVGASGLYLNGRRRGDWRFEDATPQCGIPFEEMPVGISMADFDNDGDLDVCRTAQGERRTMGLYRNDGRAHFMPITWRAGLVAFDCWGHGWFDKEGDGDLDLVVGGKRVRVFENKGNANAWLRVRLVGAGTNRGAVGARVTVHASEIKTQLVRDVVAGTGAGSQGSSILHFGLSKQRGQVRVSVRWPSGAMQKLDSVHVRQFLTVKEE